jgi:hypothetical protein
MKKVLAMTAVCVTVLLVVLPLANAQDKGAPPAQAGEKVFQGQLAKVDADAKSITAIGPGNQEMTFSYTEATQVLGADKGVQGLAGKAGAELKITYRDAAGKHLATKIETVEKQK